MMCNRNQNVVELKSYRVNFSALVLFVLSIKKFNFCIDFS